MSLLGVSGLQDAAELGHRLVQLLRLLIEQSEIQAPADRIGNRLGRLLLQLSTPSRRTGPRVRLREQTAIEQGGDIVGGMLQDSFDDRLGDIRVAPSDEHLAQLGHSAIFHDLRLDLQQALHQLGFPFRGAAQLVRDRPPRRRKYLIALGMRQLQTQRDRIGVAGVELGDLRFRLRQIAFGNQSLDVQTLAAAIAPEPLLEDIRDVQRRIDRADPQKHLTVIQQGIGPRVDDPGTQRRRQKVDHRPRLRRGLEDLREGVREERIALLGDIAGLDLLISGIKAPDRLRGLALRQVQHALPLDDLGVLAAPRIWPISCTAFSSAGQKPFPRRVRWGQRENSLDAALAEQRAQRQPIDTTSRLHRSGPVLGARQIQGLLCQLDRLVQSRDIAIDGELAIVVTGGLHQVFDIAAVQCAGLLGGLDGLVQLLQSTGGVQIGRIKGIELPQGREDLPAGGETPRQVHVLRLQGLHLLPPRRDVAPLRQGQFTRQHVDMRFRHVAGDAHGFRQNLIRLPVGRVFLIDVAP